MQAISDLKGVSINECDFCKKKYEKGIVLVKVEKMVVNKDTGEAKKTGALLCSDCFKIINNSATGVGIVKDDKIVPKTL